ncbi:MAG: PaaX family transcriptional regulator [Egibacteraceae bacterium]
MRARSALFTLFGDVVRPAGGDAWLTCLTACMGALGFSPEATRTALHRMTAEGWVAPRKVGRYAVYRLTDKGVDRLEEAAARIYRLRAVGWDGCWRLLAAGEPVRDEGPLGRALHWMGFGRLSSDLWVSPHPHGARLTRLLADHGLGDRAVRFLASGSAEPVASGSAKPVADGPAEQLADGGATAQDARIVATAWDLGALRQAHTEFIDRWTAVAASDDPREAFETRIRLVHHWRSFLFLDPGLPAPLLPPDWLGHAAAGTFRDLYQAVDQPAWTFYDALAAEGPPLPGVAVRPRHRSASPFARGLDALHTPVMPRAVDPPRLSGSAADLGLSGSAADPEPSRSPR